MTLPDDDARVPKEPAHKNDSTAPSIEAQDLAHLSTGELAELDNREHGLHVAARRKGLEHAYRSGAYLLAVKGRVKHGEWETWLQENFRGVNRTARRYMLIARRMANRTRVSDLPSQRAALAELGSPVKPAKTKPPVGSKEAAPDGGVPAEHQHHQSFPDTPAAQAAPDGADLVITDPAYGRSNAGRTRP